MSVIQVLAIVAGGLAILGIIRPSWPCVAVAALLLAIAVYIKGCNNMKKYLALFVLGAWITFSAITTTGCAGKKLEAGGAYNPTVTNIVTGEVTSQPDFAFFAVDSAFDFAFKTVDGIFLFEQKNRASLWAVSHEIKHTLDKARPISSDIVKRYVVARNSYKSSPSPDNMNTLHGILDEIQRLSTAIQAALPN